MTSVTDDPGPVTLTARDVEFRWDDMRMHYMDDNVVSTHLMNVMHLFLPEGEEWFVRVFTEALPMIHDEKLRQDVIGFIGQEAMHAQAHTGIHDWLRSNGLDPTPYVQHMEYLFRVALDKRPTDTKNSLVERLSLIAAIEHLTSFLGHWVLTEPALDKADIDPMMLDLVRWHGAEEVEHRSVAFDVLQYFDTRRWRRVRTYIMVTPSIISMWGRGLKFMMENDPTLPPSQRKARLRDVYRVMSSGLFPNFKDIGRASLRYFAKDFHPSQESSTALAVNYLATSPAARAAER
ncbi:metal-dependent hydrolase [Rhodococcus kroppenstedtii]|uniref:Metal-dependent hydrolase n=1 Tax=Rhodococcoides kroppenstedtii TaxID=293050 RepID=A0A1I0TFI1_9NOCA|nr:MULTISPECIES: metal-dependent hydrolase [Rhodococcus]AMY21105.1 hypothetical protein A3Q40_03757 [Rhodococcus sp. PBTS 1]MBT1190594.1 metal-dependent hydrolase [Rhodococcus kroppenstedtii]MBY6313966.1 metal-dependent hydrolase [Rhodococcus kroppenstedtii]MBY6321739.1 metal-dependent hydrolase [Rhodococcus kroppenstedtii]MBY6400747.1 metal-dependent hydrolase [Rhodococcus kroppenstedtii]